MCSPFRQLSKRLNLQIPLYIVRHHCVHMMRLRGVRNAVTLRRVEHKLELLAVFLQFVDQLDRVLHMDVVVHHAVDQQNIAA